MALKLYNTLTRKKENFIPLRGRKVGMYSCGPTVYNYAHIGNLRTYIFNDLLKRSLKFLGYKVNHVMNITDVDDKTINASQKANETLKEYTRKYEKIFFEDLKALNIIKPTKVLRATENIPEMIKLINTLLKKKIAYKTQDGIYFDISKSKNYGSLAQLKKQKTKKSRIASDEYDKNNAQDFAIWKFYKKEEGSNKWKAPFGDGRPGWHIECSAMSMKVLGNTLDMHTGGKDLIFPHHTNEIAQSEASTNKKFVRYWIHAGFLTVPRGKMSKSLGDIITLRDLQNKNIDPLGYRYMALTTHYREQLLFSMENLSSAKNSYEKLRSNTLVLKKDKKINKKYIKKFTKSIENDFNMPKALQIIWELVKDSKAKGKYTTIKKMDEVLGLKLTKKDLNIQKKIKDLIKKRKKARAEKDWDVADKLREEINKKGYQISDTKDGETIVSGTNTIALKKVEKI